MEGAPQGSIWNETSSTGGKRGGRGSYPCDQILKKCRKSLGVRHFMGSGSVSQIITRKITTHLRMKERERFILGWTGPHTAHVLLRYRGGKSGRSGLISQISLCGQARGGGKKLGTGPAKANLKDGIFLSGTCSSALLVTRRKGRKKKPEGVPQEPRAGAGKTFSEGRRDGPGPKETRTSQRPPSE